MVGVEVGEEDLLEVDEADVRAQQLPLRALAAVDQDPLAAATDERRGGAALGGGRGAGRPEEDDVEIHGGRFYRCREDAARQGRGAASLRRAVDRGPDRAGDLEDRLERAARRLRGRERALGVAERHPAALRRDEQPLAVGCQRRGEPPVGVVVEPGDATELDGVALGRGEGGGGLLQAPLVRAGIPPWPLPRRSANTATTASPASGIGAWRMLLTIVPACRARWTARSRPLHGLSPRRHGRSRFALHRSDVRP